jgi:uncharacterized protein
MLLMKDPAASREGPEATVEVAHGRACVVAVRQGQLLTVADVAGGRSAQLYAFTDADLQEFLSPHHTRVFSNSYVLAQGMRLVTNRRRPLMVLGLDDVRAHDLLTPAATAQTLARAGRAGEADPREIAWAALARANLAVPKLPDPVNLFLDVALRQDGSLVPGPSRARAGGAVTCRVLIDAHVVVAAGAVDLAVSYGTGPLAVRVRNNF